MKRMILTGIIFILVFALGACSNHSETPSAGTSESSDQGTSEAIKSSFTLYADFSGGQAGEDHRQQEITIPAEEMPASDSLIAFFLADSLTEWTGLDFTLNDVTFAENHVTVDWSANSTLIAGLDDREQKDDFFFYDAVSLNWFMMDSMALTLKNNLDITTVYYCSDGGSVTFTNPEDMASQGLPELSADQSYEGSAFFTRTERLSRRFCETLLARRDLILDGRLVSDLFQTSDLLKNKK